MTITTRAATISDDYLAQQRRLHESPAYGVAARTFAPMVKELIQRTNARSISDYGAGKQSLLKALDELGVSGFDYLPYDPAFPEYGEPAPADLVCCIDVLEHIEPQYLDDVLRELAGLVRKFGFLSVHTGAAVKVLPDGRNAHLIQKPVSWWLIKLCDYFDFWQFLRTKSGFWVVVAPRTEGESHH